jgi:hypothetical protein
VRPREAIFDEYFAEFMLTYDEVRAAVDPDAAVQEFFQTTYEAGADLAGWDRPMLEPAIHPDRPPRRPWSTLARSATPGAMKERSHVQR